MDLLKRRDEIQAIILNAEKTRGSGWHPGDPGMEQREKRGESPLSERPIILQDNDRIHVVGPSMVKIQAGLQRFLEKLEKARERARENGWDEPDLLTHGLRYQENVVRLVRKALDQESLNLSTQEWNYLGTALGHLGIQVVHSAVAEPNYSDL